MSDKFKPALDDVCDAVAAGQSIEAAVKEAAEEHDLPELALMNRASRAIGDVERYREGRRKVSELARARAAAERIEAGNHEGLSRADIDLAFDYMGMPNWKR